MIHHTMRYPGDPACEIVQMTRQEFLQHHPREPIVMTTDGISEVIAMAPDEIHCDSCYADPGETIYVMRGTRGYCEKCFKEYWEEYCK